MRAYDPKLQDVCEFAIAVIQKKNLRTFFESALKDVKQQVNYINDKLQGFKKHDLQKLYEQSNKGYSEQKASIVARLQALNKSNPDSRYKKIIQALQSLKVSKTTSTKGVAMAKKAKKTKTRKSGRVSVKA
ncbi:MAG: hypothetical protein K2N45_04275, partial [Helicobacter japonicus]|nr:hypothetical protein [Helicobacter japonicus]